MLATKDMPRPTAWLWLAAVTMTTLAMMADVTSAYSSFCDKPANMEICWFSKINKRSPRFGRGDPFLRFGKRATDLADLEEGFLRFGRSLPQPSLLDVLATEGALSRKRRDVSSGQHKAEELKRTTRDVEDGGFLRFGRGGDSALDEEVALGEPAAKRGDAANGDREYLRFGRGGAALFPRWGKRYLRFGRGNSEGFLRFGKRS